MANFTKDIKKFNKAFGLPMGIDITDPDNHEQLMLCFDLIKEEMKELFEEVKKVLMDTPDQNVANLLKELTDLQYVVTGFAVRFGLPIEQAFKEVHKSNMSKLNSSGKPIYNEAGKVMKSDKYVAPDLGRLL